jgi:hypothetical protein
VSGPTYTSYAGGSIRTFIAWSRSSDTGVVPPQAVQASVVAFRQDSAEPTSACARRSLVDSGWLLRRRVISGTRRLCQPWVFSHWRVIRAQASSSSCIRSEKGWASSVSGSVITSKERVGDAEDLRGTSHAVGGIGVVVELVRGAGAVGGMGVRMLHEASRFQTPEDPGALGAGVVVYD